MDSKNAKQKDTGTAQAKSGPSNRKVAFSMAAIVFGMLGMSYAAVPLYDLFCRVTGYGGTTQRAEQAPDIVLDRKMVIRFDANLARGIDWHFKPVQREVEIPIGESALVHYEAKNITEAALTGTATFNVTPEAAGQYFNKIQCFCFVEQTLEPGERVDMPLTFFVDPEIVNDPEAMNIQEITLSYTFFPVENDETVAAAETGKTGADGT